MRPVLVEVARGPVVVGGDSDRVLQHLGFVDPLTAEVLDGVAPLILEDPLVRDGVDGDRLARAHPQGRRGVHGRHVTPEHLFRIRLQVMVAGDGAATGLQDLEAVRGPGRHRAGRRRNGIPVRATGSRGGETRAGAHRRDDTNEIAPPDSFGEGFGCGVRERRTHTG